MRPLSSGLFFLPTLLVGLLGLFVMTFADGWSKLGGVVLLVTALASLVLAFIAYLAAVIGKWKVGPWAALGVGVLMLVIGFVILMIGVRVSG